MEEVVECNDGEGGMEGTTELGQVAETADQDNSTALPVPPDDAIPPKDDTTEGDTGLSGKIETKKRTKLVSRTMDPPAPPKQVEVGRRAQVRYEELCQDVL